jgi:hypothetical protein
MNWFVKRHFVDLGHCVVDLGRCVGAMLLIRCSWCGFETAVQDADEPIGKLAQRGVVP